MADKTESITVNNLLTNRNTSLAVATSVQGCCEWDAWHLGQQRPLSHSLQVWGIRQLR
jgi:hypothetical protein